LSAALENRPLDDLLEHLGGVKKSGTQFAAYCPAHGDTRNQHLYLAEGDDGRVLLDCKKGCSPEEVVASLGLEMSALFPKRADGSPNGDSSSAERRGFARETSRHTRYEIRDPEGNLVAIHHRKDVPGESKRMWWTTPEGKPGLGGRRTDDLPPYGCEKVAGRSREGRVVVVEGESAAMALLKAGIPAVGTVTGASSTPSKRSLAFLEGRTVILWPDNDDDGHRHMRRIGKMLSTIAAEVLWFDWDEAPEKGDAADHPLLATNSREDVKTLAALLKNSEPYRPPHDPATDGAGSFAVYISESRAIRRLRRRGGGVTGIRTGLPKIDRGLHGFNKGDMYIFAARPSVGKSVCIGQFAFEAARQGHRVLLQTAEMAASQYLQRMAYYHATVDYFRGMDGMTSDAEERLVDAAEEEIGYMPLAVDDYGSQTIERIRRNIEQHEPEILFVDYLQYLMPDDPRAARNQQVGQLSRDLARIKGDYNIPVVVAAQLNRASESRKDRRPMMTDLRDSGEVEQDADAIVLLYRPNQHDRDKDDDTLEMDCQKFRMGVTWFASFKFVPGQMFITDQESDKAPPGIVTYGAKERA